MNLSIETSTTVFSGNLVKGHKYVTVVNRPKYTEIPGRYYEAETIITDLRGNIIDSFSRQFSGRKGIKATGVNGQMKIRARRVLATMKL